MRSLTMISWLFLAAMPAQATTWYFQTTGSDSNPCTYVRPCRGLGAALTGLAAGDTLLALDSVDFSEQSGITLSVSFSLTVDGGPHGAFLNAGGVQVSATNANVILRNLTVVQGLQAQNQLNPAVFIVIFGGSVTLENINVTASQDNGMGIIFGLINTGGSVHMKGVTVLGQGAGIALSSQTGGPFTFEGENLTVDVSGAGAQFTDGKGVIRNSLFRSPLTTSTGLALLSTTSTPAWLLDSCRFQGLAYGLVAGSPGTIRISNSEFTGNGFGIFGSGTTISFRNNVFAGNGSDGSPVLSTSLK
jgi:hypothetical protein